jgi:hypothetical protein
LRISTRAVGIGILLVGLTIVGALPVSPTRAVVSQSMAPVGLSLSTIPPQLPADNNTYPAVVVSVLGASGAPTVALTDINVSLTSSEEYVGKVTANLVIAAGQTYAIANFTTTHTAGVTTITATTTGLATASSGVTTVIAVGYPTHLVITAVPDSVPASAASTGNLILELEDDVGLPAKAIADIPISLYSSNTNVVNVTAATAVMKQGEYLVEINYTSGFVPGSAVITASAPGFASGIATISVLGSPPLALKLQAQPDLMVACTSNVTSCEGRLVVALTDLGGNPTLATRDIQVQIRSSDLAVVNASETTTILEGNISAIATFAVVPSSVGGSPDEATITASSPGLQSSSASVYIYNPTIISPSICTSGPVTTCQLAIFEGPNPVLADHRSYSSVVVALQDPAGVPAVNDTGPTDVTLTSSVTGVGNFTSIKFAIPEGRNWASVTFTSTYQVGTTVLTASAQNVLPTETSLNTYGAIPSQVVISAISTPLPADGATHPALELSLEDAFGSPAIAASDVPVSLTSSQAGIVSVDDAVIRAGETFAVVDVTAGILQGTANVTALVSSFTSGYATSSVNLSTVIPAPSSLAAVAPNDNSIMFTPDASRQYALLAVQLQDSANNPARARAPMNITITSSNSTVISKVLTAVIGVGQDYAAVALAAKVPGTTTLTLSTPGLSTTSLPITFLSYPLVETITGGPATIFTNQSAVVSANLALDGVPLIGAAINWKVSSGGLIVTTSHPTNSSNSTTTSTSTVTSSSTKSTKSTTTVAPAGSPTANDTTDKRGASSVLFRPTKTGSVLITALVAPTGGLLPKTLNFTVHVSTPPPAAHVAKAKASLVQELTTFPLLLVPIGGAGGAVAAVFLIRKRRGGGEAKGDDEFDTSFE